VPWVLLLVAGLVVAPAGAADLSAVDRTIRKEPAYAGKPRYCLLVFGPDPRERVWLVHDGDTLYVDRNGNGDLTDTGEAVAVQRDKDRAPDEARYEFKVGELRVGGRVHQELTVRASPLARTADTVQNQPNARAALTADPKARVYGISLHVDRPDLRGRVADGRVIQLAGVRYGDEVLVFADKPAAAPIVHIGGPLQVTLSDEKPVRRLGRDNELLLVVGTPGHGPGTFAELAYEGTIPDGVRPTVEVAFPAARDGDPPVRERYELKERC
jgi:hypothetical protein